MESDISPSEFLLLKCLYEMKEANLLQLLERLRHQENEIAAEWARTTVLTILKRLQDKGYMERKKEGRSYFYRPRKSLGQTTQSVLRRFFELNNRSILCSYLFQNEPLTSKKKKFLSKWVVGKNPFY